MTGVEWRLLRADQLRQAAAANPVVILPVGSLEQHGPHLPVDVDSVLAEAVSRAAALEMVCCGGAALVLPTVWTGLSEHHMGLGGTITLDFGAFTAVIRGICRSVARHGFRRMALLNGHGGNEWALRCVADDLTPALGFPVVAFTYWSVAAAQVAGILTRKRRLLHACEAETSMMLALRPDLVDMARAPPAVAAPDEGVGMHRWRTLESVSTGGTIGVPAAAMAETGVSLIAAVANAVAEALLRPGLWE